MAIIESSIKIDAPSKTVWDLVSDLDAEPKYWKGTKSVETISRNGNTVQREVIIAFRDKKCEQTVQIVPEESIKITFTAGIILGTKTITVQKSEQMTVLSTVWDIQMTGVLGMFTGMLKKHIRGGTEQCSLHDKKRCRGKKLLLDLVNYVLSGLYDGQFFPTHPSGFESAFTCMMFLCFFTCMMFLCFFIIFSIIFPVSSVEESSIAIISKFL